MASKKMGGKKESSTARKGVLLSTTETAPHKDEAKALGIACDPAAPGCAASPSTAWGRGP